MTAPWYVAPALDELRDEVNAAHPGRDRSSDGAIGDAAHAARKSDHNPAPDGRGGLIVRARDFDVDGIPVRPILDVLERDPRTGLLIYDRRYWTRGHGWRPYTGINPHTGHFHISVRVGAEYELDTRPWGLAGPADPLEEIMSYYRDRADFEAWQRRIAREEAAAAIKAGVQTADFTDINGKTQTLGQIWRFRTEKNEATLAAVLARNPADVDLDELAQLIADAIPPGALAAKVAGLLTVTAKP